MVIERYLIVLGGFVWVGAFGWTWIGDGRLWWVCLNSVCYCGFGDDQVGFFFFEMFIEKIVLIWCQECNQWNGCVNLGGD